MLLTFSCSVSDTELDPDPHSSVRLDPDPHSECGSGSRMGKISQTMKKNYSDDLKIMNICSLMFYAVIFSPKFCLLCEKSDKKKNNFVSLCFI
jgi:hypothetical protein